eukprot:TRINITY_DN6515_c0_g1_i4.p1 TRINITY_DN6515_c0_g1~~TRINITY_DN6515_c0_g1_i4.p1  ORF type:complete len:329 (-),score=56.25 TRINITY_DN6515_c0_g1_i4:296-1282(-)
MDAEGFPRSCSCAPEHPMCGSEAVVFFSCAYARCFFLVSMRSHSTDMLPRARCSFDWAHSSPVFLPWHRRFILSFEKALQAVDPDVSLCYWDWTVDNATDPQRNRLFSEQFAGGNGNPENHRWVENGSFARWPQKYAADGGEFLARQFGGDPSVTYGHSVSLPVATNQQDTLNLPIYDEPPYIMWGNVTLKNTFRKTLEGFPGMRKWELSWGGYLHARVHMFLAGSMLASTSPNDPLFWLHHANIDRLWSLWQKMHPEADRYVPMSGGPFGMNADDFLIPWDGKRNTQQYEWYYQFKDAVPEGQRVRIRDMLVDDQDLGYVYEGLSYH